MECPEWAVGHDVSSERHGRGARTEDERSQAVTRPFTTIDAYINSCPADVQVMLEQVRRTIRAAVPAAGEAISYAMPTITLNGRDLVSFAAWKHHIALYPIPAADDDAFERELAPYRAARGTLRFPLANPVPYDLIQRLVELRVKQQSNNDL